MRLNSNLIKLRLGLFLFSSAQMLTRLVFRVLPTRYRPGRCADFDDQYAKRRLDFGFWISLIKDVDSRKDVPFGRPEN